MRQLGSIRFRVRGGEGRKEANVCFYRRLSEFLRLSSEGAVTSSSAPSSSIHMPNFLSRFIQHHQRLRPSSAPAAPPKCPMELDSHVSEWRAGWPFNLLRCRVASEGYEYVHSPPVFLLFCPNAGLFPRRKINLANGIAYNDYPWNNRLSHNVAMVTVS